MVHVNAIVAADEPLEEGLDKSRDQEHRTWLISWNPRSWNWEDYLDAVYTTQNGSVYIRRWACINTHVMPGDRVFLIVLGRGVEKGIIASGVASSNSFEDEHWNPEKQAQGIKIKRIEVSFDLILNYSNQKILKQSVLNSLFPNQQWSPQGSGIEIKTQYVKRLEVEWKKIKGNSANVGGEKKVDREPLTFSCDVAKLLHEEAVTKGDSLTREFYEMASDVVRNHNEIALNTYGTTAKAVIESESFWAMIGKTDEIMGSVLEQICLLADSVWPITYEDIKTSIRSRTGEQIFKILPLRRAWSTLIQKKKLRPVDNGWLLVKPYVKEYITQNFPGDIRELIERRVQGDTLEVVGKRVGLTRERIRQKEKKVWTKVRYVDEDRFRELFSTYAFTEEEMLQAFGVDAFGYAYLVATTRRNRLKRAVDALEDMDIPALYRNRLKKAVYSSYLEVDGTYLIPDRKTVLEYFLSHFCRDEIKADEAQKKYDTFLMLIGHETDKRLALAERYMTTTLTQMHNVLWKLGSTFRYYKVDEVDIEKLIESFHMDEMTNVEISAQYFINHYQTVAKEYDLRDGYELHNLLKKRLDRKNMKKLKLQVCRMPMLVFGKADRRQQVLDLLVQGGIFTQEQLAKKYYQMYGVLPSTFQAGYIEFIRPYLREDNTYSMAVKALTDTQYSLLSSALIEDYYLMPEVRQIFTKMLPHVKRVMNNYNLDRLGYRCNGNTVYRKKFLNFKEALSWNLKKKEVILLRDEQSELAVRYLPSYEANFDIVKFAEGQYIHINRLRRVGVGKSELKQVSREVLRQMDESYFTICSFRNCGGKVDIDRLGFGDYFLCSILRHGKQFQSIRMGKAWLFYHGRKKISPSGFLADIMEKEISIDVDDLFDLLRDIYGVQLENTYKILEIVKRGDNDLYYNNIMHRVYRDYDVYYEEV